MPSTRKLLGPALLLSGAACLLLCIPGLVGDGGAPLRVLLGWGGLVVSGALLAAGALLTVPPHDFPFFSWPALVFAEVLLVALLVLTHIGIQDPLGAALAGKGGGLLGWSGSELLVSLVGITAARVLALVAAIGAAAGLAFALKASVAAQSSAVSDVPARHTRSVLSLPATKTWLPFNATALKMALGQFGARLAAFGSLWRLNETQDTADPGSDAPDLSVAATRPRSPKTQTQQTEPAPARRARPRAGSLPPLELLAPQAAGPGSADARQRAQTLKQALAEFGVPVEVVSIKEGPTVTQFGLEPGEVVRELRTGERQRRRVSVNNIVRLSNDLALALAAPSIRIEAPVPGRPYVGVEIPNTAKTMVGLRGILESKEFAKVVSPLALALGRDVSGDPIIVDLTRMPHLLIAGATGSGKSVCINALVCSLLMNNSPHQVRFLMVDPKMVELPAYNGTPHLLGPVITDATQVPSALAWLTLQMDERYRLFAQHGVRNIEQYNRSLGKGQQKDALPYLVLIIDEMADLMMNSGYEIERQICRLAQMSRATGIHLILATQRPSVDVITGLIKANFPARVAFAVTTQIDSRVILDTPGAEKLLGRGDMLFMAPDAAKLARIQGCFVADREIESIVDFWQSRDEGENSEKVTFAPWAGLLDEDDPTDALLDQAIELIRARSHISTSMLQRQLRIGYPRAARLMEQLEEMGAVGPDEGGGRSRAVLIGARESTA